MKLTIRCSFVLALMGIVLIGGRSVKSRTELWSQEPLRARKVLSRETHERVLDIVFERNEANPGYDFILRFEPSSAPESQIAIKTAGARTQLVAYSSLSGNIYSRLDGIIAAGGKEDPVEMAKLIQVQKKSIELPNNRVMQWRKGLAESLAASMRTLDQRALEADKGIGTITIDGTFYRLWYNQVGSHLSFTLLDQEVDDREVTGELQLVRWMNSVRLNVVKGQ